MLLPIIMATPPKRPGLRLLSWLGLVLLFVLFRIFSFITIFGNTRKTLIAFLSEELRKEDYLPGTKDTLTC
jgi:hypothetical protein